MADSDDRTKGTGQAKEERGAPPDRRTVAPTPDRGNAGGDESKGGDRSMLDTARDRAEAEAHRARETAAGTAHDTAEQVREAGEAFGEDSFARAATDRVAEQLDQAARTMREADLRDMGDDLAAFARRQPLLFFGGAALLGFAAARLLKASERADDDRHAWDGDDWNRDRDMSGAKGSATGTDPWGSDTWDTGRGPGTAGGTAPLGAP
jgi:hypothetical protein